MKHTGGPIRVYATAKYNKDTMPVGKLKAATLDRLKPQLEDENGYTDVSIENGEVEESAPEKEPPRDRGQSVMHAAEDLSAPMAPSLTGERPEPKRNANNPLNLPGVDKGTMDRWMGDVMIHNRFKGTKPSRCD